MNDQKLQAGTVPILRFTLDRSVIIAFGCIVHAPKVSG